MRFARRLPASRLASPLVLSAIALFIAFWQRPHQMYVDTRIELLTDPWLFLERVAQLWTSTIDLGHIQASQFVGYLFPMGTFFALGDTQYENGNADDYAKSYDPSYGRLKSITRAVIGNHEYYSGGDAFWDYFGSKGGPRGKGWYSFDVGAWHVVGLNSNCDHVSCSGEQLAWFKADLEKSKKFDVAVVRTVEEFLKAGDSAKAKGRPLDDAKKLREILSNDEKARILRFETQDEQQKDSYLRRNYLKY